jgi:adenylate kinase family enzyme
LRKIVIFGNSASGKSTLAKQLSGSEDLSHLDLDTLAWAPTSPPERRSLEESRKEIEIFLASNDGWVIEGCYSDLIELVLSHAGEVIYLDLPTEQCISNAEHRPWESHKYESKEAQDQNLAMLIEWISQYSERKDTFSRAAHQTLYEKFTGRKTTYTSYEKRT